MGPPPTPGAPYTPGRCAGRMRSSAGAPLRATAPAAAGGAPGYSGSDCCLPAEGGQRRGWVVQPLPQRSRRGMVSQATFGPRRRHSPALPWLKMSAALCPEGRWRRRGSLQPAQTQEGARASSPCAGRSPSGGSRGGKGARGGGGGDDRGGRPGSRARLAAKTWAPPGLQWRRGRLRASWAGRSCLPGPRVSLRLPSGLVTWAGRGCAGRRQPLASFGDVA